MKVAPGFESPSLRHKDRTMTLIEALAQFITEKRDKEIKRNIWPDNEWWYLSSYRIYHLTKADMQSDDWEVRDRVMP